MLGGGIAVDSGDEDAENMHTHGAEHGAKTQH